MEHAGRLCSVVRDPDTPDLGARPRRGKRFPGWAVRDQTSEGRVGGACVPSFFHASRTLIRLSFVPRWRGGQNSRSATSSTSACVPRWRGWHAATRGRGWISTPQFCAREFNPFRAWGVEVRVVPGLRPGFKLDPVPGSPEARSRRLRIAFEGAAGVQIDAAPGLAPGLNWGIASRISTTPGWPVVPIL